MDGNCNIIPTEDVVIPALGHDLVHHEAQAATCTEAGWDAYDTCSRCDYTTYAEIPALDHDLVHHEAQAATCTEAGWEAYDTCSRCDYTTYVEIPALGHDIIHHDAQAATCTDVGWDAYDTCSRCDYTTYTEIPALDHDLVHHEAQAATCTEIGWEAYDTCSRCDYSTYAEISALGHTEVADPAAAPTCTQTGLTAGSHCAVCGEVLIAQEVVPALGHTEVADPAAAPTCTQTGLTAGSHCEACGEVLAAQTVIPALGHRFGLWEPAGDGKHQSRCYRCGAAAKVDCAVVTVPSADPDAEPITICPICGHREGADLVRVNDAKARGAYGNLVVFTTGEEEELRLLTVAFEWNGRLLQPGNTVTLSLPAALIDGCDLLLIAPDGTETQIVPEIADDRAVFTLDFMTEDERLPVRFLRLQRKV